MREIEGHYRFPVWMKHMLAAAGIYNMLWGAMVVLWPHLLWARIGAPSPSPIELWQCIGMMVAVFGVGYFITSFNPIRYWPMVLAGFLGKLFGAIGFGLAWYQGALPQGFGWTILFGDLIWLGPFGLVLREVYLQFVLEVRPLEEEMMFEEEFGHVATNKGWKLQEMSERWPLVVVFLRHFGCTFCREALQDLGRLQDELAAKGKVLVLVHMGNEEEAGAVLAKYGLQDVHHISDNDRRLYRYFGLQRGFLSQLAGPKVWVRGIHAGIIKRHGLNASGADAWQMPGIFLYHKGRIRKKFIHRSAADVPDYRSFIAEQTV